MAAKSIGQFKSRRRVEVALASVSDVTLDKMGVASMRRLLNGHWVMKKVTHVWVSIRSMYVAFIFVYHLYLSLKYVRLAVGLSYSDESV